MTDYALILAKKYPGKMIKVLGNSYDAIDWKDESDTIPKERLDADYQDYLDETSYKEKRAKAYPEVVEQLDMLWAAIDADKPLKESEFFLARKAVKEKFPKPEKVKGAGNGK